MSTSKIILSLVGIVTSTGCYIADFNHTHIYNPRWPGHAKFHAGQTMSIGLCLGLLTLYILWKPVKHTTATAMAALERERLEHACLVASLYWVTQLSAFLYPGIRAVDVEFGDGAPQLPLSLGFVGLVAVAYWLGKKEQASETKTE